MTDAENTGSQQITQADDIDVVAIPASGNHFLFP
jgi:hypothetical protein